MCPGGIRRCLGPCSRRCWPAARSSSRCVTRSGSTPTKRTRRRRRATRSRSWLSGCRISGDLACKGLALLDCAGGLTAALERSCDAIQHEAALGSPTPSLGATSPHASPGASPQINVGMPPAAQIFLACVVLAPMVAVAAQLVKGRRRTAADLSFPGLPQSDLASAAAAASASELL
ncbi:hypothetical protein T492DRAFT_516237 [Pavlovales sp. CCMP2436]|nr:hypothetical protein T492DRAFT_516237 [Pavlovales sp. CCMP2436]|mmetsp:Transcript_36706/g.86215  ORF Transcript_36706/g.86215 Transcript_36706/m.86215 type:complete len:176 (-) Transcript_36706:142-669(-)